ncbi:MAG: M20/M25/M40 family metallo-hydrolase [Bacteroidetes bacterium]|nr:M20/M25/M40 family metallo-hydrolase [Bacteroidota bacterium]
MENKQHEIVILASEMMKFPAFSIGEDLNIQGIHDCFLFISDYLKKAGLNVEEFSEGGKTPSVYADCSEDGTPDGKILLSGHFDKVSLAFPEQINPVIENDYLKGRGSSDMLTVVATYMVFMKDLKAGGIKNPGVGLLLVGNEEDGEAEKWGTPFVLSDLKKRYGYVPELMIVGERTGNPGDVSGLVEHKNRGIIRIHLEASGKAGHTATLKGKTAFDKIMELKEYFIPMIPVHENPAWKNGFMLSYLLTGENLNFNTIPGYCKAGFEIRAIPEDSPEISSALEKLKEKASLLEIEVNILNAEAGVESPPSHILIQKLLKALSVVHGGRPGEYLGKGKPHGTQARFCPEGCAQVVFGQLGYGPHSADEGHYIPSIMPYYRVLKELATMIR